MGELLAVRWNIISMMIVFMGLLACNHKQVMQPAVLHDTPPKELLEIGIVQSSISDIAWKNEKRAAYSITFDDARVSHWQIADSLLRAAGIPATFFLNTKYLIKENVGNKNWWWSTWQALADAGHEIGSHTYSHTPAYRLTPDEFREELRRSKQDILENITGINDSLSFSFPESIAPDWSLPMVLEYFTSARSVCGGFNRGAYHGTGLATLRCVFLNENSNMNVFNSYVDDAIRKRSWLIVGIHSISRQNEMGPNLIPQNWFQAHLKYVVSRKDYLWIAPQGEIVRYIKSRDRNGN
jgi:peptidoglycan/xylan/chitin deacetylase (PgdA/CDA1 family)